MSNSKRFVTLTAKQAGVAARLEAKYDKSTADAVRMARDAVTTSTHEAPLPEDVNPN